MWIDIIRKTIQIEKKQNFYGKKWLLNIVVIVLFLLLSRIYQPWVIQLNLIFLAVTASFGFNVYSLFERNHCEYLFVSKNGKKSNLFLMCTLVSGIPYLCAILLQLIFFYQGSFYVSCAIGILEYMLASCMGMVSTYFARIGKYVPVVFFGAMVVLTWEQNERIHLISPAALLYNVEIVNYYALTGIAALTIVLLVVLVILGKICGAVKRIQVGLGALLAFVCMAGSMTALEVRQNHLVETGEYLYLAQKDQIQFRYKGIEENEVKTVAFYLQGLFMQMEKCGFEVPQEIIIEKYVKHLTSRQETYCEYYPEENSLKIIITSNGILNAQGEQLPEFVNMIYRSYAAARYNLENKYAEKWMLTVGDYSLYKFTEMVDKENYTAAIRLFRQTYEFVERRSNTGLLEKFFQKTVNSQSITLYDVFCAVESQNPKTEDELKQVFRILE